MGVIWKLEVATVEMQIEVEVVVVRLNLMLDHGRLYSTPLDSLAFAVVELAPLDEL